MHVTQWKFNTTLTNVMSYVTRSISQDMADNLTKNFFLNNLMNLQNMSTIILLLRQKHAGDSSHQKITALNK